MAAAAGFRDGLKRPFNDLHISIISRARQFCAGFFKGGDRLFELIGFRPNLRFRSGPAFVGAFGKKGMRKLAYIADGAGMNNDAAFAAFDTAAEYGI